MKYSISKRKFMNELHWNLLWKYEKNDIKDIMEDYEEYFDIGLLEGKNEEDICRELGSPVELVGAILLETPKSKSYINKRILQPLILSIIMLSIITYLIVTINDNKNMVMAVCFLTPIVTIGLWKLLDGVLLSLSWLSHSENKKNLSKILVYHLLHILLALSLFWFMKFEVLTWGIHKNPYGMEMWEIGPFVTNILYGIIFILFSLLLFGLYKYSKTSMYYFTIVIHEIGMIGTIFCFINTIHKIDNLSNYKEYINLDFLPYLISILVGIIYTFYCNKLVKEVK